MLFSQIPSKFTIPFANSAPPANTNVIPLASQIGITAGAASLTDGFPPLTFVPLTAGGVPPWGRDMNGLMNQVTAWLRWQGAGSPVAFDATFAAAIGGYPQGALLQATAAGGMWASLVDNNTTNPDTTPGNPNWAAVAFITPVQNSSYVSADDTGSADLYIAAPTPPPVAYAKYQRFQFKVANTNLTTTPTLNVQGVSGLLGAKTIIHPDGTALTKGEMLKGMVATVIYDGQFQQLQPVTLNSTTALRVLEINGSGQAFAGANGTFLQLVTCITTITRTTLVTSIWTGSALIVGAGEDGLWSVYGFTELNGTSSFYNLVIVRSRVGGGTQTFYWPTVTVLQQPSNFQILDLGVGDTVQFYLGTGVGGDSIRPQPPYGIGGPSPNFVFTRLEGLHT
jgi:hypothetical protein